MKQLGWMVVVVLGAWGLGGTWDNPASAGPEEDVEALRGEVKALRAQLAHVLKAHASVEERLAAIEDGGRSIRTSELLIEGKDGKPVVRIHAASSGGGRIEILSKTGKRAALLFARSDDDGELALYDHEGRLRGNIGGNDDGGYANFYGSENSLVAYIGGDSAKKTGYIGIYGTDKQEIVGLYGNPKGGVVSCRNSETKKQIVMIGAAPNNGMGFAGLGTADGKPALACFVTRNGGQVKALNAEGRTAAFIGVSADPAGNGLSYICRKDGKRVIECGTTETGGGYQSMHNGTGKRVLFLGCSSGSAPDDGVLEVARKGGKLGVVLRAFDGGSSVRVYDNEEKVKRNLR